MNIKTDVTTKCTSYAFGELCDGETKHIKKTTKPGYNFDDIIDVYMCTKCACLREIYSRKHHNKALCSEAGLM